MTCQKCGRENCPNKNACANFRRRKRLGNAKVNAPGERRVTQGNVVHLVNALVNSPKSSPNAEETQNIELKKKLVNSVSSFFRDSQSFLTDEQNNFLVNGRPNIGLPVLNEEGFTFAKKMVRDGHLSIRNYSLLKKAIFAELSESAKVTYRNVFAGVVSEMVAIKEIEEFSENTSDPIDNEADFAMTILSKARSSQR